MTKVPPEDLWPFLEGHRYHQAELRLWWARARELVHEGRLTVLEVAIAADVSPATAHRRLGRAFDAETTQPPEGGSEG